MNFIYRFYSKKTYITLKLWSILRNSLSQGHNTTKCSETLFNLHTYSSELQKIMGKTNIKQSNKNEKTNKQTNVFGSFELHISEYQREHIELMYLFLMFPLYPLIYGIRSIINLYGTHF